MKKHPVDDLFRKKIADVEMMPSANAWRKIGEKRRGNNRPAFWIWYVAASVLAAGLVGYSVFENQQEDNLMQSETQIAVNKTRSGNAQNQVTEHAENSKVNEPLPYIADSEPQKKALKADQNVQTNAGEKEQDTENEVAVEIQSPDLGEPSLLNALRNHEPTATPDSPGMPAINPLENVKQNEPDRVIVIAVEAGDESIGQPKVSKFSKIFRQLKNARAGERVDWNEVGFNPKNLVAKVDDRLRSRDDRTSEKNHLSKEKNNL